MKVLQEKLNFLLEKYSVDVKAELKDAKTVVIDGQALPLLSHRNTFFPDTSIFSSSLHSGLYSCIISQRGLP